MVSPSQIPLIVVSRYFRGTRRGNVIMWMSLFAGQPLLEVWRFVLYLPVVVILDSAVLADIVFQGMVWKPRVVFLCGLNLWGHERKNNPQYPLPHPHTQDDVQALFLILCCRSCAQVFCWWKLEVQRLCCRRPGKHLFVVLSRNLAANVRCCCWV
jgi:hypothetical protein